MSIERIPAAQAMVKALINEGITEVFGYPGAAICPFYDYMQMEGIRHILVRHEANAGHAANGYARITGKPAVCVATSGPGATNLITAIATAYMDSIPMVVITGQVNTNQIGRDVFQEADITGAAEPFVKHSYLVKDADLIPSIFKKAFYIAGTGRPGPVLIDVPFDMQKKEIDFEYPETVEIRSYKPTSVGNKLQIKRVVEALSLSTKPLICAGGGLFSGNARFLLQELVEKCEIPVVTTMMGISSLPTTHSLLLGMLGMHGKRIANQALAECDLLILLGARVGDRAVTGLKRLRGTNVIHIDIDPAEIGKNLPVNIPVVGNLENILEQILEAVSPLSHKEWVDYLKEKQETYNNANQALPTKEGVVHPKAFFEHLNAQLPENVIISADVGQNQIWTANSIRLEKGRFITSGGMGTMGYSVPAAIGAKKARPDAEVIAICGDGSFQMQMMELATMIQHDIHVKMIVFRNNRLGMVCELQNNLYCGRLTAVHLDGSPDFVKLAAAYGIQGECVSDISKANDAIKRLLASDKPYLLQVEVDANEKTILE